MDKELKIRDSFARINGNKDVYVASSGGIEIIGEDGGTMFSISISGRELRVDAGNVCKQGDLILDDRFSIKPIASNCITITKDIYKEL